MAAVERKNALAQEWDRLYFDIDATSLATSFSASSHDATLSLDIVLNMLSSIQAVDQQDQESSEIYQQAQGLHRAIHAISFKSSPWAAETSASNALRWLGYVRQLLYDRDASLVNIPPNELQSSVSSSSSSSSLEDTDAVSDTREKNQTFTAPIGPLTKKQRHHARRILDAAEVMFLFKVSIVVYSSTCQKLIDTSYPVLRDTFYWREKDATPLSVASYGLQIAPSLLFSAFKQPHQVFKLISSWRFGSLMSNPFYISLKKDIRSHIRALQEVRMKQAEYLGTLLQAKLPLLKMKDSSFTKSDIESIEELLNGMVNLFDDQTTMAQQDQTLSKRQLIYNALENSVTATSTLYNSYIPHARPSWLMRYWPLLSISAYITSHIFIHRLAYFNNILDIGKTCAATFKSWWSDWIWDPLVNILKTIRRNNETSELVLTGTESIRSDLASLERMVVQYAEEKSMLTPDEMQMLAAQVKNGDLTLILQEYEENLKSPLRNALTGDLIRVLLIQVQKAKLDLEIALHALDKLLRSNELNFALLAVAPSLLVLGAAVRTLRKYINRKRGSASSRVSMHIKISLREVERRLNRNASGMSATEYGLLIMDLHLLRQYSRYIPSVNGEKERFLEDIRELEEDKLTVEQKLAVIQRMWRVYDFIRRT